MKTSKNILLHLMSCISLLCLGANLPALANDVKEMTLAQKVDASDLVFIARVTSIEKACVRKSSCATLRISQRLKGQERPGMSFLFNGDIAEDNPLCCRKGGAYLFFLKNVGGNYYRSANGPYGVYSISEGDAP